MTVLKRAQDLAQTFLTELQRGKMIKGFSNAGASVEELLIGQNEYQTCEEYGDMQVEYVKALDFMDMLTENL
eukprot:7798917-Prorocentrum_lima.AAC.1